jgi:Holliday junction resolvase RusA-like endonuclease
MPKIKIKPLSVNECWQGKRFKTPKYKSYEIELLYLLPKLKLSPPYDINVTFGMSALSDIDNPIKPFLDILQKKYGINDRDVMRLNINKVITKDHFIEFEICTM